MSIDTLNSVSFRKGTNITFLKLLKEKTEVQDWHSHAQEATSNTDVEYYFFTGGIGGVNEFVSERLYQSMKTYNYFIKNRKWEITKQFDVDKLADIGYEIKSVLPEMAECQAEHPGELFLELLEAGEDNLCYDGLPFYANNHIGFVDGTTYSNLLTGTGTTVDQIKADFDSAVMAFLSMKKRNGRPLFQYSTLKFTVYHSLSLYEPMSEVFDDDFISGSNAPNKYKGRAKHFPDNSLTGNSWYVDIVSKEQKPFIFQVREKPYVEIDTSKVFDTRKVAVGGFARYGFGYNHPFLSIKIKNT